MLALQSAVPDCTNPDVALNLHVLSRSLFNPQHVGIHLAKDGSCEDISLVAKVLDFLIKSVLRFCCWSSFVPFDWSARTRTRRVRFFAGRMALSRTDLPRVALRVLVLVVRRLRVSDIQESAFRDAKSR
jgi:hypothetical protein